jgi:hypothetical protein
MKYKNNIPQMHCQFPDGLSEYGLLKGLEAEESDVLTVGILPEHQMNL